MQRQHPKIAFIGAGNMCQAIAGGLIESGLPAKNITLCSPTIKKLEATAKRFGTNFSTDNIEGIQSADVVVLAVKPAQIAEVCKQIAPYIDNGKLLVSVAAGITTETMQTALGKPCAIARSMPNTPSQVKKGATGIFATSATSEAQRALADKVLSSIGITTWVQDESLLDTVTAVSGSGPAYFFLFMEAMIDAAVQQGMDRETATALTLQTAEGAATLAKSANVDVVQLRKNVTSPKGTTERAIQAFENESLREMVSHAMDACQKRAKEIADEFK